MAQGVDPNNVLHASMRVGETPLMISDDPSPSFQAGNQVGLTWSTNDEEELNNVWARFVEGGSKVDMELEPTFFSRKFGSLTDPYGVVWMLMLWDENEDEWQPGN